MVVNTEKFAREKEQTRVANHKKNWRENESILARKLFADVREREDTFGGKDKIAYRKGNMGGHIWGGATLNLAWHGGKERREGGKEEERFGLNIAGWPQLPDKLMKALTPTALNRHHRRRRPFPPTLSRSAISLPPTHTLYYFVVSVTLCHRVLPSVCLSVCHPEALPSPSLPSKSYHHHCHPLPYLPP